MIIYRTAYGDEMLHTPVPKIEHKNLANAVLQLKTYGEFGRCTDIPFSFDGVIQ